MVKKGAIVLSSAQFYHDSLTRTWFFPSFFVWRGGRAEVRFLFRKTKRHLQNCGCLVTGIVVVSSKSRDCPFVAFTVYLNPRSQASSVNHPPVRFHVVAVMMSSWCDFVTSKKNITESSQPSFLRPKGGGVKSLCLSQTLWQVHPRNSTNRYHKNGHP